MDNGDIIQKMAEFMESGREFALATVVSAEGSTLAKPGFKLILSSEGEPLYGTLGGACPESAISALAQDVVRHNRAKAVKVHLEQTEASLQGIISRKNDDEIFVETFCGGTIEIFIEPYMNAKVLTVIKQGGKDDVADSIFAISKQAGLKCDILDLSDISRGEDPLKLYKFTDRNYVVVLTKGNDDIRVLEHLSRLKLPYLGLMASRKRFEYDSTELKGKVSEKFLKSIHSPIGIGIGAISPGEIAISIISEVIMAMRQPDIKKNA